MYIKYSGSPDHRCGEGSVSHPLPQGSCVVLACRRYVYSYIFYKETETLVDRQINLCTIVRTFTAIFCLLELISLVHI
jgi:hypothetical protein